MIIYDLLWSTMIYFARTWRNRRSRAPQAFALQDAFPANIVFARQPRCFLKLRGWFQRAQLVWSDEALVAAELHDLPLGLSDLGGSNLCSDLREAAIHGGWVGFEFRPMKHVQWLAAVLWKHLILDKSARISHDDLIRTRWDLDKKQRPMASARNMETNPHRWSHHRLVAVALECYLHLEEMHHEICGDNWKKILCKISAKVLATSWHKHLQGMTFLDIDRSQALWPSMPWSCWWHTLLRPAKSAIPCIIQDKIYTNVYVAW